MIKTIATEVARTTQTSRGHFLEALEEYERVANSILEARKRLEECGPRIDAAAAVLEKTRAETAQVVATYNVEFEKYAASRREIEAAKDRRRKATNEYQLWATNLNNAKVGRDGRRVIEKLEANEPPKPSSITIPEPFKMDAKIEAEGLAALHAMALAGSDYAVAVAARRECLQRLEALEADEVKAESVMLGIRKELERDVSAADAEFKRRIAKAEAERAEQIQNLKRMREDADARLKAMGVQ